jgi:hypothetical protein
MNIKKKSTKWWLRLTCWSSLSWLKMFSVIPQFWLLMRRENLLSVYLLEKYSMQEYQGCIKLLPMDFKLPTFINCVTTEGLQLLSLKHLLDIHSVDSLLLTGNQVVVTRMILSHSYSLSTSKPNTLLLILTHMLSIAIHHMGLHLVMAITSVYKITPMVGVIIMSLVHIITTSLFMQMGMNQYWLMAIETFKLLKSKYI